MNKQMLKKNWTSTVSMVLAVLWLLFSIYTFVDGSKGLDSGDAEAIGTALGMAMVVPYMIVALVGTILHTIGGIIVKRGLFLSGLILECVSILLMPLWGFGYIVVIIFGFIGYSKMPKKKVEE